MFRDLFMDNMTNDINYFLEGNAQTVTHSISYVHNEHTKKTVLFMHESMNLIMAVVSR